MSTVYTPQEIIDFLVRPVAEVLEKEFGKIPNDKDVQLSTPRMPHFEPVVGSSVQ